MKDKNVIKQVNLQQNASTPPPPIIGRPLVAAQSTSSSGGGSGAYQVVDLPPSSIYSTPTVWTKDSSMVTSAGNNTSPQVIIGDKLYRIKSDSIDIYNLKTKILTQNAIVLNFAPVVQSKSTVPFTVCVYEGYKILIVHGVTANSEIGRGSRREFTLTALSVNTTNNTVSKLSNLTFPWISSLNSNDSNYNYTKVNSDIINSQSIYLEKQNKIIIFPASNILIHYYYASQPISYHSNYDAVVEYDIKSNLFTVYRFNEDLSFYRLTYNYRNGVLSTNAVQNIVYISSPRATPTQQLTYSVTSHAFGTTVSSGMTQEPSEWVRLSDDQYVVFNGTTASLYDPATRTLSAMKWPNAIETPNVQTVNTYNNQIVYMTSTGFYSIVYVPKNPTVIIPVYGIGKGQQFAGLTKLEILNKPTIQPYWQTAEKDFEINLGEYNSPGEYRLLVKS